MATPQPCAHCGAVSDTAQRCTGCLDGSDYLVEDVTDTFYCSKKCQKKHWSVHKADCEKVAKHKQVFRFGGLLKQVFLAYKETFYEHDVSKIEIKDGIFALYCDKTGEHDGVLGRGWRPFPAHLAANDTEREAALTIQQCGAALSLLGPLARKLMRGTGLRLKSCAARIRKPIFRTRFGESRHTPDLHGFIMVKDTVGEDSWVVDPTAGQYGISDACFHVHEYVGRYCVELLYPPQEYTETVTKDLGEVEFLYNTPVLRADFNLERRMRLHFAAFVANNNSISKTLLQGSDAVFDNKLKSFLTDLKLHLAAFNN